MGFENEGISFYQYEIENKIDESVFNTDKLHAGESPPNYIKIVGEQLTRNNRIICVGDNKATSYFYIVDRKYITDKFVLNITKSIRFEIL